MSPNFKGPSNGIDFSKEAFADYFEGDFIVVEFGNDLIYDENAFVSRCLSSSYAPKPDEKTTTNTSPSCRSYSRNTIKTARSPTLTSHDAISAKSEQSDNNCSLFSASGYPAAAD